MGQGDPRGEHQAGLRPVAACRKQLSEANANSLVASPCNVASALDVIVFDHQREVVRNSDRTGDLKTGADR
jgi:hypothetical protein